MLVPYTGTVYNSLGEIIAYRNNSTGEVTSNDGYTLDSDFACTDNKLVTINGIAQIIDGEFQRSVY